MTGPGDPLTAEAHIEIAEEHLRHAAAVIRAPIVDDTHLSQIRALNELATTHLALATFRRAAPRERPERAFPPGGFVRPLTQPHPDDTPTRNP